MAANSLSGLSQFQYRPFYSRSRLWCFQYREYKRGNKLVVCLPGISSCWICFFFGQFYPMPLAGQRLEEPKNRRAVKDGLKTTRSCVYKTDPFRLLPGTVQAIWRPWAKLYNAGLWWFKTWGSWILWGSKGCREKKAHRAQSSIFL